MASTSADTAGPRVAGSALLESMADPEGQGIPPEAVSRDPEVVRAYTSDPLVLPTMMFHGEADLIADPEGAREHFENLGSEDKELRIYDGLHHECMNEPERVLADLLAWLDERTPA